MKILLTILIMNIIYCEEMKQEQQYQGEYNVPEAKDVVVHFNHEIPFQMAGHGNYKAFMPLQMIPPQALIQVTNPLVAPLQNKVNQDTRQIHHIDTFPQHLSNPFNLFNYYNVYNPNMSQITGASPLHSASLAQHPFTQSGMIAPFNNPYMFMNPMAMGMQQGSRQSTGTLNVPGVGPFYQIQPQEYNEQQTDENKIYKNGQLTDDNRNLLEEQIEDKQDKKQYNQIQDRVDEITSKLSTKDELFSQNQAKKTFERKLREMEKMSKIEMDEFIDKVIDDNITI